MAKMPAGSATLQCPVTQDEVFAGTSVLSLSNGAEIICPSCGRRHVWNAELRKLVDSDGRADDPD